jgi:hypothetical protein
MAHGLVVRAFWLVAVVVGLVALVNDVTAIT